MDKNNSKISILETNVLFLIIALILVTLGAWVQYREIYTGLLITEYLIILLPIILFLKIKGLSLKSTLNLNRITFKQAVTIIFIVIFSYPIAVFLNFIGITILSKFTEVVPSSVPIPTTYKEYITSFFIIALTPGICEEIMFRGLVLNSYEKLGRIKALIYSSLLFGLFHFNLQNLLGPIFLGLIFGIIRNKTNSLFSSIIAHTANNTIALTIGYIAAGMEESMNVSVNSVELPEASTWVFIGANLVFVSLLAGIVVYKLIKSLSIDDGREILEINNFVKEEFILRGLYKRKRMNILEKLPILIVIFIYIFYNYKFLTL
ncbi:MAG: CPBP family intramembrane metalloprotease [Tissierellia bacterium]|nr:CPBP family intramembrane metalloprotease [Tissierellia bacterium]